MGVFVNYRTNISFFLFYIFNKGIFGLFVNNIYICKYYNFNYKVIPRHQ